MSANSFAINEPHSLGPVPWQRLMMWIVLMGVAVS